MYRHSFYEQFLVDALEKAFDEFDKAVEAHEETKESSFQDGLFIAESIKKAVDYLLDKMYWV